MIILNIYKTIKISLKNTLNDLVERCFLLLAVLACASGLFSIAVDLIERYIHKDRIMDQEGNNQDMQENAEQADEMIADVDDIYEADEGDVDFDDDFDEDAYESEDENEDLNASSDSDNDYNMNVEENSDVKKERDYKLQAQFDLPCFGRKPMYNFLPYHLSRDIFLNKSNPDTIPAARSGHRIIANGGNLYSLGGYNPRSAIASARYGRCMLFQELWTYNFATRRWKLFMTGETMPNMPRELASNALVTYNNVLISYGGTGYPFGESCSNDCYVFSTGHEKPFLARFPVSGDLPTPLYGPAIVIHEDYLYTIGGTTGFDYSCDVFRLNLKTRIWESMYISRPEMRDDPEGRYRHEIVYDGKYIYVLGGGTSLNVYDLQRIPAFNLKTNRWEYFDTLPDRTLALEAAASAAEAPGENVGFPKPRKCFSCVQHKMDNGDIVAFISGGLQGDFSTYFDDIWKLNLSTMQWTLIRTAKLPKALYFHSAADTGNGLMYIFGGIEYDKKDMRRRNRVYKMWMTIPKLSEICWEAVTYYNDYLCTYNRNSLLSYGIPKRFVDRVEFLPKSRRQTMITNTEERQSSMACTSL